MKLLVIILCNLLKNGFSVEGNSSVVVVKIIMVMFEIMKMGLWMLKVMGFMFLILF